MCEKTSIYGFFALTPYIFLSDYSITRERLVNNFYKDNDQDFWLQSIAFRTIPVILDICRDMEEVCPDASDCVTFPLICGMMRGLAFTLRQKKRWESFQSVEPEQGTQAGIAKVRQFSLEIWIMSWEIMVAEKVPLVLIGSVFRTMSPYLLEPYLSAVHEVCPAAYLVLVDKAPVMGAIRIARKMADAEGA